MIGRLLRWPWRRRATLTPALEASLAALDARIAGLERSLAVKLEAQLVTLTRALAEVITAELARERRRAAMAAGLTTGAAQQTGAHAVTRPSLLTAQARDITRQIRESSR